MAGKPFILTMGSSGVGKSSLLNALVADQEAFDVSKDAKAGKKHPKVVEKDHVKVMDSGGFADPDGQDIDIGVMLYEQFKRHGAPSTILVCSAGVRHDEVCQRVVCFLHRVFGDQALSRIIFVLTQHPLDDKSLKMHEKEAGREVPKQPDDEWRTAIVQRWREELSTGLNEQMKKHKWLGGMAAVPVFILDSHAKLFDDVADDSEVNVFDEQVKLMLELSTKKPLSVLEILDKKLRDFLEVGVPQLVSDLLQQADKSEEGQQSWFLQASYINCLLSQLDDPEKGLEKTLCKKLGAIVVQEIKDDMKRHGITESGVKKIQMKGLCKTGDGITFGVLFGSIAFGVAIPLIGIAMLVQSLVHSLNWSRQRTIADLQTHICKSLKEEGNKHLHDAAMRHFFDYSTAAANWDTHLKALSNSS